MRRLQRILLLVCCSLASVRGKLIFSTQRRGHGEAAEGRPSLRWRGVVINLQRRPERLALFAKEMQQQPVLKDRFCRLRAVDGQDADQLHEIVQHGHISPSDLRTAELGTLARPHLQTSGAVGCYESHMRALSIIASDTTVDFGLVAEDDLALYSEDFNRSFAMLWDDSTGVASGIWRNTDVIFLQRCYGGWPRDEHVGERRQATTELIDVSALHVYCSSLYAVSREAAQRLTSKEGPLYPIRSYQWDFALAHVPGLRRRAFRPPIAQALGEKDDGGSSDVQPLSLRQVEAKPLPTIPEC